MFLGCFSKEKKDKCDQKNQSFSDKFRMIIPSSDIYFLEANGHVCLKVAIDDSMKI